MGGWCIVIKEMFHSQEGIELIYKKSLKLDERDWVSARFFIVLHTADWLTARCGYWNLLFVSPWRYVLVFFTEMKFCANKIGLEL